MYRHENTQHQFTETKPLGEPRKKHRNRQTRRNTDRLNTKRGRYSQTERKTDTQKQANTQKHSTQNEAGTPKHIER
jgi:hypothetical protein